MPVFFALGIGGYFLLLQEPALFSSAASSAALIILLLIFWRYFVIRILLVMALLVSAGFFTASLRSWTLATPVLEKEMSPRVITGLVTDVRHYSSGKLHIILEEPQILSRNMGSAVPDKIRLKVQKYDQLPYPGDRIRIRAGLMPPPAPTMPGDFDYARQLWFQGIGAVGYAVSKPEIIEKGAATGLSTRQRFVMAEKIRTTIAGDAGGLAAALITGQRSGISREVAENMRSSGLAHLLAISGLHMGLLTGVAFFFSRFLLSRSEYLTLRYPVKKWAALIAMGAGLVYVYLSGGAIPTVRAFIMVSILFMGILLDRKAISLRLVAIAAMVILVLTPEVLLSVSFQMSFAAVVALVAVYEKRADWLASRPDRNVTRNWRQKMVFYVGAMLLTTLIAELAIAPFALFHFNKLVQYGLLANLLAMPVMAFWVMPWVVVYLVLAPFGLGAVALYPMSYGLEIIIHIAEVVSGTPGSYSLLPTMGLWPLVAMALGAIWFAIWRTQWRIHGLTVIIVGFIAALLTPQPDILIDNGGRLIGVRNMDQDINLSSLRAGAMTRQRWAQRSGQEKAEKWPQKTGGRNTGGENDENWMSCDRLSCLYYPRHKSRQTLIALIRDELALEEDCRNAQLVISLVPVNINCPSASLVIDKWDFYHKGGHALWLPENSGDRIVIKTVAASRGNRPWSKIE
ncbi:DNA internalization-related competence protein ComEC/Rec2 [hydrothermal vent metagenome]|uniref:DNA internalization-related competence protein ComEC/Rec2 n=1 Tax=hydrothermal vent metagenome TaxID=652676 RepID=A0A3B0SFP1_9ZZZZ